MADNKRILLNIAVNIVNFGITIIISLFVTPLIVNRLGGEAYGFVGLANSFVGYAALITVALNSMSGRYISIEIYRDNYDEANKYYSSTFFANLLICAVLAPVLAILVWKLQLFIDIPESILADVKITFAVTFAQFLLSILLSRYEISTFVTNRLYLSQKNSLISSAIRLLLILICFNVFTAKISYVVLATFAGTMFVHAMNFIYTKKFLPDLQLRKTNFDFEYIKRLLASGVWNLINKLSAVLLDGLDLLLSNVFLGPLEMGALAISKTVPALFTSLRGTLDYPFTPPMTKCYANNDIAGVVNNARMGNKVLGILMVAPMATFAVYGRNFFRLWVPGEDSFLIQALSLLAILNLLAGACINSVFTVFTVTNKVKVPSLVMLGTGIITVVINFCLLSLTNLGVYVIAGVSSVCSLVRNYIFTPLYGARCLGVKKSTFYREIITGNVCLLLNLGVGVLIYQVSDGSSWISLIISCGFMAAICVLINFGLVLNKNEKVIVYSAIKDKISGLRESVRGH